jgi:2-C-methyl-D-erythritol 2,4-cyclodiphosphate synthase
MSDYRIGYGEDIHRLAKGDHLTLGGVRIPFAKAAVAHSDGDVVFHAVADSLLGSLALGDIGDYFPPSDKSTEGIDSALIVKKAVDLIENRGFRVSNLDIMIILEEPHLAPYKEKMRSNISKLLHVDVDRVSIKAGTNEKLDSIGKGEAIKTVAIVLVEEKL